MGLEYLLEPMDRLSDYANGPEGAFGAQAKRTLA